MSGQWRPPSGSFPCQTEEDRGERKFWERAWSWTKWVKEDVLDQAESTLGMEHFPTTQHYLAFMSTTALAAL